MAKRNRGTWSDRPPYSKPVYHRPWGFNWSLARVRADESPTVLAGGKQR